VTAPRLDARLRRLECMTSVLGCPACEDRRGRLWIRTSRQQPDGTVIHGGDAPVPCVHCGLVPEQILEIIEVVVESREDLARLDANTLTHSDGRR
jgi:hypothetical protein